MGVVVLMNTRLVLRLAGASRLVARRPAGREGGREGGGDAAEAEENRGEAGAEERRDLGW